jgi:hypothetical protein
MGREKAIAAIQRVLGSPTRIELDAGDSEIVLVPAFLVEAAGPDISCVSQMHTELRRELARIEHREQRRQQYLTRERERHSRPMGLVSLPQAHRHPARDKAVQIANTVPAPLALH